jgi:PIN domain nuclease of toxin-antitoxin system
VKLLLDTSTFLFLELDTAKLSALALAACKPLENELYLSAVSSWEISVKYSSGKLRLPEPPGSFIPSRREMSQILALRLDERAALYGADLALDPSHKDPFDRLLVCQAIVHGLTIVSPDRAFQNYPVQVLW